MACGERGGQLRMPTLPHKIRNSSQTQSETLNSKAGLFRRSAVVRGAVDTGCRRNYIVRGFAQTSSLSIVEEKT